MIIRRYWNHAWYFVPQAILRGGIDKVHAAIEVTARPVGDRAEEPRAPPDRWENMAMRLFLVYAVVELAVLVVLASTIGFGWTILLLAVSFLVGLALAGSQVRRHLRRLRSGLTVDTAQGAVTDSVLVALGTVLVVIPGLASSVLGALLLLPPTRAAARPVVTAMAARRAPLIVGVSTAAGYATRRTQPDYIDGEVIDVVDDVDRVERPRLPE